MQAFRLWPLLFRGFRRRIHGVLLLLPVFGRRNRKYDFTSGYHCIAASYSVVFKQHCRKSGGGVLCVSGPVVQTLIAVIFVGLRVV